LEKVRTVEPNADAQRARDIAAKATKDISDLRDLLAYEAATGDRKFSMASAYERLLVAATLADIVSRIADLERAMTSEVRLVRRSEDRTIESIQTLSYAAAKGANS